MQLLERRFSARELAGDANVGCGFDHRSFDRVSDIESVELGRCHHRFRRSAVGDERIVARNGNDLAAQQLSLRRSFEIETRFERLRKAIRFGGFSRLGHAERLCLS